ncbi:hypothetical protein WJX77_007307 [Trebouxia sp. C0004]
MAATRTNPVHLLLQAVAGVALTTVGYYSLFREDSKVVGPVESTVPHNTVFVTPREGQQYVQSELDREAQNTTNRIWQIKKT